MGRGRRLRSAMARMHGMREAAMAAPGRHRALTVGDWSLQATGKGYTSESRMASAPRLPEHADQRKLGKALQEAVELSHPKEPHCGVGGALSWVDRASASCSGTRCCSRRLLCRVGASRPSGTSGG